MPQRTRHERGTHDRATRLTEELLRLGSAMDALVLPYVRPGDLSVGRAAGGLDVNFRREDTF